MAARSPHGTRTRYVAGCRCDECKSANAEYSTKTRERRRGSVGDKPVLTSVKTGDKARGAGTGRPRLMVPAGTLGNTPVNTSNDDPDYEPGPVERGVIAELQTLSAARKQPGLAEGVRQMARLLDSRTLATSHAPAMRQMAQGLEKLHAASAGRAGKLADVALLSRREEKTKPA